MHPAEDLPAVQRSRMEQGDDLFGGEPREVLALRQDLALLRGLGDRAQLGAADREVVVPV